MQSGIDSSRLRISAELPTQYQAQSQPQEEANASPMQTAAESAAASLKPKAATTVASATGNSKGFFGPEGPSFRDVFDAINPLNHIPVVSDILAAQTGHEPSTASKLAGGALFGPIGFAASLASVIFENGTGKTPANAVYAALTGDETGATEVQVAKADTAVEPVDATELALLDTATGSTADAIANATTQADAALAAPASATSGNAVLDLYGASSTSAHASYKKAQLLPYLRDVNTTKVM